MKRSCPYCGRVHDYSYVCPKKSKPIEKRDKDIKRFRGSDVWKSVRADILDRDKGLCVVCRLGLCGEPVDLVPADSVHHIIPLAEDFEQRTDPDNLISLCDYHHELAENGRIPAAVLLRAIADKL